MKLVAGLFALMLAVAAASYAFFRGAGADCVDLPGEELASPDGRAVAARYEHRCGAAAPTTQVSLRVAGAPFPAGPPVFVAAGTSPVQLSWSDARTLVIATPARDVVALEATWRNVGITLRRLR